MSNIKTIILGVVVGMAMTACAYHGSKTAESHGHVVQHTGHSKLGNN